jgi:hypothetical protein
MNTARALQAVPESCRNFAVPVDMDATNIGARRHRPSVPVMISRGWWRTIAAVLTGAIGRADLVISLLPVPLHGNVARLCVKVCPHRLSAASFATHPMPRSCASPWLPPPTCAPARRWPACTRRPCTAEWYATAAFLPPALARADD